MSLENLFKIRPRESLKVRNVDEQKNQLTYWICVEESAWSSEYSLEDAVMEGNRGRHAERKEVDSSDHGRDHQGENYGCVDQQIKILRVRLNQADIIKDCLVDACWRGRKIHDIV